MSELAKVRFYLNTCRNRNDILTPSINLKYHLWVKKTDSNLSL